jgi:hypothetical protein
MVGEKAATHKLNSEISSEKLENIIRKFLDGLSQSIKRGQLAGAWLYVVLPSIINGTDRLCDMLTICYGKLYHPLFHTNVIWM